MLSDSSRSICSTHRRRSSYAWTLACGSWLSGVRDGTTTRVETSVLIRRCSAAKRASGVPSGAGWAVGAVDSGRTIGVVNSRCVCMPTMLGARRPGSQTPYVAFSPPGCEPHHQGVLSRAAGQTEPSRCPTTQRRSKVGRIYLSIVAVFVAAASFAPPALARPAPDVTFGGRTSAKWPVMVQLSRDGRRVAYAVAAWTARCTDGVLADNEEFSRSPVSAGRKFSRSYDTGNYQDGSVTVRFAASITGKINKRRSRITGTVRVMSSVRDAANGVDETCDTGTVKYVAIN